MNNNNVKSDILSSESIATLARQLYNIFHCFENNKANDDYTNIESINVDSPTSANIGLEEQIETTRHDIEKTYLKLCAQTFPTQLARWCHQRDGKIIFYYHGFVISINLLDATTNIEAVRGDKTEKANEVQKQITTHLNTAHNLNLHRWWYVMVKNTENVNNRETCNVKEVSSTLCDAHYGLNAKYTLLAITNNVYLSASEFDALTKS